MVYKAFIIHGTGASSKSNWFPWLKTELKKLDLEVFAPDFPIGKRQNLGNWLAAFDKYINLIDEKTVMIGHSLGPAFIMDVLERLDVRIATSFLVAPFAKPISVKGFEETEKANSTFVDKSFDWERIKKNCSKFYVYASDNDPFIPLEECKRIARNTDAVFRLVHGAKHFTADDGYPKFDQLLTDIGELIAAR